MEEAKQRFEAEKKKAAKLEETVSMEIKRCSLMEAEFGEFRARLAGNVERLCQETADARAACKACQEGILQSNQELEDLHERRALVCGKVGEDVTGFQSVLAPTMVPLN